MSYVSKKNKKVKTKTKTRKKRKIKTKKTKIKIDKSKKKISVKGRSNLVNQNNIIIRNPRNIPSGNNQLVRPAYGTAQFQTIDHRRRDYEIPDIRKQEIINNQLSSQVQILNDILRNKEANFDRNNFDSFKSQQVVRRTREKMRSQNSMVAPQRREAPVLPEREAERTMRMSKYTPEGGRLRFRPRRNMRPFETARVSALDDDYDLGLPAVSDIEDDVVRTGLGDFSIPRRAFPEPEPTFGQEDE
tara:strand:+ start:245 stop:979 length:735 start_codon:yes stop_codon:yes gene_type:complete